MARVFQSATGARVVIASDDHCPPHAHAMHPGERWVVRVSFSFLGATVTVMHIAPADTAVRHRQLNVLLGEMKAHLRACRRLWWEGKATTRLENKWLVPARNGRFAEVGRRQSGAVQVVTAKYDWQADTTTIMFGKEGSYQVVGPGE